MLGACSDQGWEYLHAWSREGGVLLMLGASTGQGLFLELLSACMAREGSFTHVRRVLRPRVGISACMVSSVKRERVEFYSCGASSDQGPGNILVTGG